MKLFTTALLLLPAAAPAVDEPAVESRYLTGFTDFVTRAETPIIELPFSVEIITESFIEDTAANSLRDALRYTAGLETHFTSLQQGDTTTGSSYRLRGFVQDSTMRNGFRVTGEVDLFNVSQIEVLLGPSGLLNGTGTPGGTVVYHTRRPTKHPFYSIDFAAGSNEFRRIAAVASGPVNEHIRYAVSALFSDTEAWYDHFENEVTGFAPVIEWQPFKNTTLLLDAEYLKREETPTEDPFAILDNAYRIPEGGTELERIPYIGLGVFPLIDPQTGEALDLSDQRGFLRYPGRGDEFRWISGNEFNREDYGIALSLVQRIGENLSIQAGYYYSETKTESRTANLSLTSADDYLSSLSAGEFQALMADGNDWLLSAGDDPRKDPFGNILTYNWLDGATKEKRDQFRLEAAYDLPVNEWWTNHFTLGGTYDEIRQYDSGAGPLRRLDRATLPEGDPNRWEPGDDIRSRYLNAYRNVQSVNDPNPIRFDTREGEFFARTFSPDEGPKFRETGLYFVHQGTFFDNRVRSITGLRHDKMAVKGVLRDTRANTARYTDWIESPSATTHSFGISMQTDKNSPWSVYLLSASSIEAIFARYDATGRTLPPGESRSYEAGLKFYALDGRLSGTLSVYEIEREDVPVVSNEINLPGPGEPAFSRSAQRTALRDDRSRGVDLSTIITDLPFENLQTVIGFSYTDYKMVDLSGLTFEDPNSDDAPGLTPRQFFVKDLNSTLPSGRQQNGTPEYSFRAWSKYTFREGPLDGLDISLGFRWTDKRESVLGLYSANSASTIESFFEEDALTTWDAAVGYNRTYGEVRCRIQLNVFNLTDEEGTYGYAYRNPQGREMRVTVSLQF